MCYTNNVVILLERGESVPKFFVIADVHGFYDEMIEALNKAGFDKDNKDHFLISLGDETDRGPKNKAVINYLNKLERAVFVRGNHSTLFENCCLRGYPQSHDFSNGTFDTIDELSGYEAKNFNVAADIAWRFLQPFMEKQVDYFETKNYIFVHAWIPVNIRDGLPKYYTRSRNFEYNPEWRYAHALDWEDCKWMNPFETASQGLNQTGKIIVHGHWHNSAYWAKINHTPEFSKDACFDICEHDSCIGVDACTAYTHKCNILVLEDEFLED